MSNRTSGFIIVLTMMLIATSVLLVSLVINRVSAYRRMGSLWTDREKAKMIALGGIEIAISQLAQLDKKDEKNKKEKPQGSAHEKSAESSKQDVAKKDAEKAKALVNVLFTTVNKWQTFPLKTDVEGIEGECSLYVSSEQGKINLNGLYDVKKKKFVTMGTVDGKKFCDFISEKLKPLLERQKQKPIELTNLLENFFKNHQALDDVTELFTTNMQELPLFREPEGKNIAFNDLFTVMASKNTLDPFAFSTSLNRIIGVNRTDDVKKIPVEELFKLSQQQKIEWEKAWSPLFATLYGKDYSGLPAEIKPFLATRFETTLWSVVSYGKVGTVTSKVYAIIEKSKNPDEPFQIKKIYWLS